MGKAKAGKTKLSLGDFLGTDEGGSTSWADEMDAMPSAPGEFSDMPGGFGRGGGRPGFGDRGGDFDSRPPRADVPFPDAPPYTAFVGNMSFECSQEEVNDFFTGEGLTVTNIRMVSGFDGKSKGFCYAEFPEAEMLRSALSMTGAQLAGRTIRISVAEPPKAGAEGRSAGDWTRSGPLPDLPGRGGSGGRMGMGMERTPSSAAGDSGRDWGDARGSKFQASVPSSPALGSARSTSGFGGGFGADRREPQSARMGGGFAGSRDRDVSAGSSAPGGEDRDWSAMRGGRFQASPAPTPTIERRPSGFSSERKPSETGEARDWRARAVPTSPPADGASTTTPPAPVERRKLVLAARSASSSSTPDSASPATPSSRSNPFGAAQPVDTAAREQALLDAKIEKERAEAEERRKKNEADAAAAAAEPKKSFNPFGDAKPVDNSSREKEVEAKLQKEREELANKSKDSKAAEEKSANPGREWKRPAGPHAGLTDQQATAPDSVIATASAEAQTGKASTPAQPKQILKNAGIRKEGFSYSNIAGAGSGKAPASDSASAPSEKKDAKSQEAESKSANPNREWKKPAGPHAGLTDQQATAPNSILATGAGVESTPVPVDTSAVPESQSAESKPEEPASSGSSRPSGPKDGAMEEAESKSANPSREWKTPAGPHAGLTDQQATAPQSLLSGKADSGNASNSQAKRPVTKEALSYSNIAGGASGKTPAPDNASKPSEKKDAATQEAESKSANPNREWKKPAGPHAGLTDQQATAPNSLLSGNEKADPAAK